MEYVFHLIVLASIYGILAMSLDLAVGYTGLPVLGHAAFALVGAYTAALVSLELGLSPWLGLLAGGVLGALAGGLVGMACVELRGDYLALATFAFGEVVTVIARTWKGLTHGPLGLPGIPPLAIGGTALDTPLSFAVLVVPLALGCWWLLHRVVTSPFGRVAMAIRDDEEAAMALGKATPRFKNEVLGVSASLAGFAGALYVYYVSFIDPTSFTVMDSFDILLMAALGGLGSLRGPALGAILLVSLPEALRFVGFAGAANAEVRRILYGLILVVVVMYRPQGLVGRYRWR